ncbi:unnamed protein product, partial [marine sediment metagenome]
EKPTQNYTKFPNCILDSLDVYSGNELKIIALMVRKNIGYTNPNKQFSLRYLMAKLNISKPTAMKDLMSLLKKKTIIMIGEGKRGVRHFDVNWKDPDIKGSKFFTSDDTSKGKEILPDKAKKFYQVKDNKVKENINNNTDNKLSVENNPKRDNKEIYNRLLKRYFILYQDRFGVQPIFDQKEGGALKNIIKKIEPDKIEKLLEQYINDKDSFIEKQGHGMTYFQTYIKNNWAKFNNPNAGQTEIPTGYTEQQDG